MLDRKTLLVVVAALAVGYWLAGGAQRLTPETDRPVLRWIVKTAKSLLWIALVAEPAPPEQTTRLVQSRAVGEDGYPLVDHGQGW